MSQQEILQDIQSIISSKNPLSILFSLTQIREKVLELGDRLINSIESTYYDNTVKDFSSLLDDYKKSGFFGIIYAFYSDSGYFKKQRAYLDAYFEDSYYKDIDFYFYVLSKNRFLSAHFSLLFHIYKNSYLSSEYRHAKDFETKKNLITKHYDEFAFIFEGEKGSELVRFLDVFMDFPFGKYRYFEDISQKSKLSVTKFMRNLLICSIQEKSENKKYIDYFQRELIENVRVRKECLNSYSNSDIIDLFLFLRSKLLDAPKYNINLTKKNDYRDLINTALKLKHSRIEKKFEYVLSVETVIDFNPIYREAFYNVLRKMMMYDNSLDLIDALFGIHFLPREAFYEVKKKTREIDLKYNFPTLSGVKDLASLFEESFIMKLIRPFIIHRLAKIFNKRNDVYYFVKFILTLHECENYKEYKNISKFFLALEAYGKTGIYGHLLRHIQFGWIYILFALLFLFAPLGVFLSTS